MSEQTTGPGRAMDEETRVRMRAAARRVDRVNERLHLGGALAPEDYAKLTEAGITHLVDLREAHEDIGDVSGLADLGISRRQVPVKNQSAPRFEQLLEITQWIDEGETESTLYVHCGGGFGRAAVMSAALLVHSGASVEVAVAQLKETRPEIRLNEEQMAWLREVEARLRGGRPGQS